MNFRRWVVFTFVVHIAVIAVDKCGGLILWWLTKEHPMLKGEADLLTTLPFILTAIANLGLATSLVWFVRRKKHDVTAVAETTSLVAIVWGGLVAAAAIAFCTLVMPAINPSWDFSPWLIVPVCLCVPFQLVTSYFNSIQLAVERVRDYSLVHLIASALFVPLFLVCYFAASRSAAYGIANARILTAIAIAVVTVWMLRGIATLRPRMHWAFFKDGVTFGWKANLTSVLTYLNHRLDLFLVFAFYVGSAQLSGKALTDAKNDQVAFFSFALTFAELVWHFPEATRDLFFSKVASISEQEARRLTPALARICFVVAIVGSLLVYVLVDPVLDLITASWRANWAPTVMPALLVLMPGTIAFTVGKILQNDLAARGRLGWCIAACVLNFVTMVVLDVLWIPAEGALGAARASSISFMLAGVFTLWAYQRSGGAPWWECVIPRRGDLLYAKDIARGVLVKLRLKRADA